MPGLTTSPDISADSRPLPRAWLVVGLLWGVGCLNYLDRSMLTTMRDSVERAIPMGDDDFGALFAVFFFVYGALSPLGGWCADRFGRSRVILVSLGVWSAVTLGTAYAQTYDQLLATRVLMGVSEACYIPAALALIADYHRSSTRSLATGIHMSGIYAGVASGGMGGWMADNHGWTSGFTAFGGVGLAFTAVLAIFLRDVPGEIHSHADEDKPPPLEAIRALGGNSAFRLIALYWGLLSFTGLGFMTWMPTFLREHYHLTQTKAGFTATVYMQVAAFLGVLIGGAWADRGSLTELRGRVRVPMITLTLAAPFVFMTSHTEVLWFAVVCLIAFGFARGCADSNMMPILCQIAEPRHRATGYGVLNFFGCCAGGCAAYLGGWLKVRHVDLSYMLMGCGLVVLVCGLMLLAVKPARRE